MNTLDKIKLALRTSHSKLDADIQADIDACMADLRRVGVRHKGEEDPLIFNAIKLWCRSLYTDDPVKAAEWLRRYEKLKSALMETEGYGWVDGTDGEAGADE